MDSQTFKESKARLISFIDDAIAIVGPNDPTSIAHLLWKGHAGEEIVGRMFIALRNDLWKEEHETRLSIAGFKFFWEFDHKGNLTARVGGDQTQDHSEAFLVMTMLLKKHGLLHPDRFEETRMQWAPLSENWFFNNWENIQPWAWYWVREHPELLPSWIE